MSDDNIIPFIGPFGVELQPLNVVLHKRVRLRYGKNKGKVSWTRIGYFGTFGRMATAVLDEVARDQWAENPDLSTLVRILTMTSVEIEKRLRDDDLQTGVTS